MLLRSYRVRVSKAITSLPRRSAASCFSGSGLFRGGNFGLDEHSKRAAFDLMHVNGEPAELHGFAGMDLERLIGFPVFAEHHRKGRRPTAMLFSLIVFVLAEDDVGRRQPQYLCFYRAGDRS